MKDGAEIANETASLHFLGYIAYRDAFNDRQYQPFRSVWEVSEVDTGEAYVDESNWKRVTLKEDERKPQKAT